MSLGDLQRMGLAASDRVRSARLDKVVQGLQKEAKKAETGTIISFNPNAPLGVQYQIAIDAGNTVYGQPITPRALAPGAKVAVYLQGDKCLFDGL